MSDLTRQEDSFLLRKFVVDWVATAGGATDWCFHVFRMHVAVFDAEQYDK